MAEKIHRLLNSPSLLRMVSLQNKDLALKKYSFETFSCHTEAIFRKGCET